MTIEYPDIIIPTCGTPAAVAPLMSDMQGFSQGCRTLATCQKVSAARNRNIGLDWAKAPIIIMADDDIGGFFGGWWKTLIKPLEENPDIILVSARLLKPDRSNGMMMFTGDSNVPLSQVPRVPTACIAFRNDGTRFDDGTLPDSLDKEGYIGSGFEDDDFMAQLSEKYPQGKVVINNDCKLIHFNDMKNQGGEFWTRNKSYFYRKWRESGTARIRVVPEKPMDEYRNIPKIIHFVWIGSELPVWARANIDEFKRLNPEFEIKVHGEDALDPVFKKLYSKVPESQYALSMKADLIRLSVIKKHGGWFFDVDFWPLVSLRQMCADSHESSGMIIFASGDRNIVANGAFGCRGDDSGLDKIIQYLLNLKLVKPPKWWDYGTMAFFNTLRDYPELFCVQDLKKIIPATGKAAAMEIMASDEKILEQRAAGAWAIHFEMTGTTDADNVCTVKKGE